MAPDELVQINARPQPMPLDPSKAAVIVVDMENDFGAVGGMFHRAGLDISGIQAAIAPTARVLEAARRAGIPVVYLSMAFRADLSDIGAEGAPNCDRHLFFGAGQSTDAPDGTKSRFLIRDTWNTQIVSELTPAPEDKVVYKHRFSGFFETELDTLLRSLGATDLIFTGCTTSVCVESTLRDAMFRDYRCLLLEDCTAEPIGDGLTRSNHDASLLVIEVLFGWVSNSADLIAALERSAAGVQAAVP
ncbi:MAG TPA: cysteine hydrolase [Acidimicrobiales bacterium]|nr:cysteine hydrolase [Acidimicrobiales bacterium]